MTNQATLIMLTFTLNQWLGWTKYLYEWFDQIIDLVLQHPNSTKERK